MARVFICTDTAQESLLGDAARILSAEGHRIERGPPVQEGRRSYAAEERARYLGGADVAVFTNRHDVTRDLLTDAVRLLGICYPVTGVESLDLAAANDLGIIVGHGRVTGNAVGMAEATVMLMLNLCYGLQHDIAIMKDGGWARPQHRIRSLQGKIVGLIGFGRIAREVATRLSVFGVTILTTSPRAKQGELPAGVAKVTLDELLRNSDVVAVLTGLTPETHHLIGASQLALMKPDSYLVNTGRGAVIDELALVAALRERGIAGAALDTFATEPLPEDSPLRLLDNVILTPHCAGHTEEGIAEFVPALVENVRRIAAGRLPLYCKNPEAEVLWRERLASLGVEAAPGAGAMQ